MYNSNESSCDLFVILEGIVPFYKRDSIHAQHTSFICCYLFLGGNCVVFDAQTFIHDFMFQREVQIAPHDAITYFCK